MKKHSRFEYKTFAQRRERMVSALRVLDADEDDTDALSILQDAIDDNANTIEYLKYMTPFYKQVVASRFHEMSGADWEVCEYTAERVLDVDQEDDDTLISWVFEKVRELYTHCGDTILAVLSDLRMEYLRQNPSLDPNLVFDFGRDPLDRVDVSRVSKREDRGGAAETRHFHALWVDIESRVGYFGIVYAFLSAINLEYSDLWPRTDLVHARYDDRSRKGRTYNIYDPFETMLDCVQSDKRGPEPIVPMWMTNTVHSVDFYCDSIHLTPSKSGRSTRGPLSVTPETFQTKVSDYRSVSWTTHKKDLPLVTSAEAPRSLVFSWDDHNLCEGGFKRKGLDATTQFGESCVFLFSKSSVTLCKQSEFVLETVSLLSAVAETIPCIIEYVHPEHIAFIGQQGDLPILVIDESGDPPRPFVCYILSELRKYLLSSEYQSSDNLNSVPVLTRAQVDEYLISGQRPNPSREWFETQSLQNDENGFLINPDTNSIYWYHGMWPGYYDEDFYDPKESNTLYLSSSIETAKAAALANIPEEYDEENEEDEDIRAYYLVYTVKVKIPESQIFDVRKALNDEAFRKLAFKMIPKDEYRNDLDIDYFKERDNLLKLLHFGTYDYVFNEWDISGRTLVDNGFVGWIEQEFDGDESLTLALYELSSARKRVYVVKEQDFEDGYLAKRQRPNPSREWFETQRLQNDENGYLINPDTGGTLWYHGSRIGDCDAADETESGHVYLSSDRSLALLFMNENPLETGLPLTLCTFKVRIPAAQIYDVRSREGTTVGDLHYTNFDYDQESIYESGGYAGYIEVENTQSIAAGDDEPLTIAIYYPFAHALIAYEATEYCPKCGSSQEMKYEDDEYGDEYRECPQCGLQIEDSEQGFGYFVVRGKRGVGAGH